MSSDLLRRAADRLETLANNSTGAVYGWRVGEPGGYEVWADRDAAGWDAFMVATTATRLNPDPGTAGYADAAYIATMHPGVGQALAAWLRYEAGGEWRIDGARTHALNLASAILGESP